MIYGIDSIHGANYVQRRDALPARDRNGRDIQSGVDEARRGDRRD